MSEHISPLKQYRRSRGMSLQAVADIFGVTRGLVLYWENKGVSAERALQIEETLKIPRNLLRPDLWNAPVRARKQSRV